MSIPFIDLKTQYKALKPQIDARIHAVLDHGMFIMGPEVTECENALADYLGCKHAIACSNGSDALLMAMLALDIGPGDEVITTSFSFIATIEMIVLVGAKPVVVDIDPESFNIDPTKIEAAVTDKTKAIVPVGLYGQAADMNTITEIAKKNNLYVLEDAAQSFGADYHGKKSSALGDISCTSFFPAKPLGCYGDGGAVFTDNDEWAARLKSVRIHGMGEHRYHHTRIGINGRMDSIQCGVIIEKLKRYPEEVENRNKVATRYTEAFTELQDKGVSTPIVKDGCRSVWAQYTLRVPNRDVFQASLKEKSIPTAVHYPIPMADQPAFKEITTIHDITQARKAANEVVSLPMFPDMTHDIQDQIIETVLLHYQKG